MSMRLRGVRWTLRSRLAEHPRIYLPIARRKYPDAVLSSQTELLIEGFTRSAVTFATIAFQLAQPEPVRVAHTLHSAGHVIDAVRSGVPSLVVIREPEETVLSAVVREPYVTLDRALTAYTRFYAHLQPVKGSIVVAEFDTVVHDFGSVIRTVNQRFGTRFAEFQQTDDNVKRCYDIIEDRARRPPWSKALGRFQAGIIPYQAYRDAATRSGGTGQEHVIVPERRVQRPSRERDLLKDALRDQLHDPALETLRTRASDVYARFVSGVNGRSAT
jgi:hypothetical protein